MSWPRWGLAATTSIKGSDSGRKQRQQTETAVSDSDQGQATQEITALSPHVIPADEIRP